MCIIGRSKVSVVKCQQSVGKRRQGVNEHCSKGGSEGLSDHKGEVRREQRGDK